MKASWTTFDIPMSGVISFMVLAFCIRMGPLGTVALIPTREVGGTSSELVEGVVKCEILLKDKGVR